MTGEHVLRIEDLWASVGGIGILQGIDLEIRPGEVHAVMGPNGSGKSTLSHVLMGRPGYEVTAGSVTLDGVDLLGLAPWERAQAGLFLCLQHPTEVPGVSLEALLVEAARAGGRDPDAVRDALIAEAGRLGIDERLLDRPLPALAPHRRSAEGNRIRPGNAARRPRSPRRNSPTRDSLAPDPQAGGPRPGPPDIHRSKKPALVAISSDMTGFRPGGIPDLRPSPILTGLRPEPAGLPGILGSKPESPCRCFDRRRHRGHRLHRHLIRCRQPDTARASTGRRGCGRTRSCRAAR